MTYGYRVTHRRRVVRVRRARAALWGQIVLHRAVAAPVAVAVGIASDHDGSAPVGRLGLEQASKGF